MKSFFIKLAIFVVILLTLQVIVSISYPPPLPDEILQVERHLQNGTDIIYLGDSTLTYPGGEVTTTGILQELLSDQTIGQVAHPAYNLDLYRYYADYITQAEQHPDFVIIPINLRSFSPEWDLRPVYQFEREKMVLTYGPQLSRLFYRPFDTLGGFDSPLSPTDFLNAPVFNGKTPVGRVADFEALLGNDTFAVQPNNVESAYYRNLPTVEEQEALESRLIYYYMYDLSPTHRKIQSMVATSRRLKANGIKPIFYVTPLNYQLGERILGEAFSRRITENVNLIENTLQAEQVDLLNLVFDLEAYNFVDTEHLTENGKTHVAEALATFIEPAQSAPSLTIRPTPPTNRPGAARVEPQPVALQLAASPTPASSTLAPVVPFAPTPSAGQGAIKEMDFIGTYKPIGNYFIDLYRVRYRTLTDTDRPVNVRANIYIPQVSEKTAFPILVYGGGTTGLGPGCEPLNELSQRQNWGGYHYQMLEYAAQGFIIVWPNGQGYDDGQPAHPYFIAKNQGRTMLDAARAVYRFFDEEEAADLVAEPLAAVFFGGYSSGGHAAFAAKDLAADYAPDLAVKGILGHGPTTNIETLLKENPIFSPYLVYAYSTFFGEDEVDPTTIFNDRWLPDFEAEVMTRCVDTLYDYYSPNTQVMYRPPFREALYGNHLQSYLPKFKRLLSANAAGLSPAGAHIPVLILQGTADTVITPPSQEQFATQLCRLGHQVTYLTYLAADHDQARNESFRDTITWMETLVAGELPESSCDSLAVNE